MASNFDLLLNSVQQFSMEEDLKKELKNNVAETKEGKDNIEKETTQQEVTLIEGTEGKSLEKEEGKAQPINDSTTNNRDKRKRKTSKTDSDSKNSSPETLINIGIPVQMHRKLKTLSSLKGIPVRNLLCEIIEYSFDKKYEKEMKDLISGSF